MADKGLCYSSLAPNPIREQRNLNVKFPLTTYDVVIIVMMRVFQGQSLIDAMFPGPVGKWVEEATPAQLAEVLSLIGNNFIAVSSFITIAMGNKTKLIVYSVLLHAPFCFFSHQSPLSR